jgi:hypothetical protein
MMSLDARTNVHGPASYLMNTGFLLPGFPSMGAWISYALGRLTDNLPTFVVLPDPRGLPYNNQGNFGSGFLPVVHSGTILRLNQQAPIAGLYPPRSAGHITPQSEADSHALLRELNQEHLTRAPGDSRLEGRIASYELAARMQLHAPEALDLARETQTTQRLYGVDQAHCQHFARSCLTARRLLERGVRFVQLFNGAYAMGEGVGNWDGHKTIKSQYEVHAPILDQPAAALLTDLRARGLMDDTLVAFVTEFGRMPTFQKGANGRDHNPAGFTVWLSGAGVKAPFSYGATDEFGHKAVQDVATIYDLHATILHLLGLDHERLSVYHNGIQRRLTDVHGHVLKAVLA